MRYIKLPIQQDLQKKMVFIGGPRQVGKTTLAREILAESASGRYLNWDYDDDRQAILQKKWSRDDQLLIFDELHKYPQWKSWVKGLYDVAGQQHHILVTGSARLDVYRQGGDSLLGRYHYWRLHPFTLDEMPAGVTPQDGFQRLMTLGGFPEPFLTNDLRESRRWRKERFDKVLQEDIRDLESIRNIQALRLLLDLLRTRVGGMVVISNLAQDIQVAPQTAQSWLESLERMYVVFRVMPYARDVARAILKPPKVYFFDNADVVDEQGARFENLIATTLLKRLHYREDYEGYRCELRYIRDKEGHEVDFAILQDGVLEELIEVKYSDDGISPSLRYFTERLKPKRATQIVATLDKPYDKDGIRVTNPFRYFAETGWSNKD
ncbi:ATP-binding protein [Thiothrix subterranea]|uniref:AAA family ATPase n=2 Tax=Thiothrix subterranea TaxID=2735563 RepID=A0AA51MNK7_9GAMM|nr:AAA family ATPase [Thiothrix subterranea]MDQ5768256.1 AAA family ATPase [Thiothrix subterranea]WML87784.1 AAA family ATPase [Thiothrix subterranea]